MHILKYAQLRNITVGPCDLLVLQVLLGRCNDVALKMTHYIKLDYTLSFHIWPVYTYTKMESHSPVYVIH